MREIKFRGYCERDSEWRYGSYITDGNHHEILTKIGGGGSGEASLYGSQVDYDTVSQFTGINDAEGVDIYEGDICINASGRTAECLFHGQSASFDFVVIDWVGDSFGFSPQLWPYNLRVIGNIHENPELLNREK